MKTTGALTLRLADSEVRRSLISVLAPDNKELPGELVLRIKEKGKEADFKVVSSSAATTLSTILAILRDTSLFEEIWLLSHEKDAPVRRA